MCFCSGHDVDHVEEHLDMKLHRIRSPEVSPYAVKSYHIFEEVPCGKCLGCTLDRALEWSNRCLMEMDQFPDEPRYFLTLTYDNEHLPVVYSPTDNAHHATLRYRDVQLFLKRLRKYYPNENIRFLCCGEYGGITLRPHYHMILIGHEFTDLIEFRYDERGYSLFKCPSLEKLWKNGFVSVGTANKDSAGYVARYNMKSSQNAEVRELCELVGIEKPRLRGSRRPALGREFILSHAIEFLECGSVWISTESGGVRVALPRYGDKLLQDHELYAFYKANKRVSLEAKKTSIANTQDLEWYDFLQNQGLNKELQTKALKRISV